MSVGAFGKLPAAADFIALDAKDEAGVAFQEWLVNAVGLARERLPDSWTAVYESSAPIGFAWSGSGARFRGTLFRSHDRSGRQFPLALFSRVPAGYPGPAFAFHDLAAGLTSDTSADYRSLLENCSPGWELSGQETPLAAVAPPESAPALANLMTLATRARAGFDLTTYALRLPLPPADPGFAPGFWAGVTEALCGASLRAAFWTGPPDPGVSGVLDLWLGEPQTLEYLFLLRPDLDSDLLYPLADPDPEPGRLAA
mgnify:FL=1